MKNNNDKLGVIINNAQPCIHCYGNMCSIRPSTFEPIYIEDNISRTINIHILVNRIPHEILVKIYNDYIRPHKFAQLFRLLTINSMHYNELYEINIVEFVKHFKIFTYTPIRNYIMKVDREFNFIFNDLQRRNYTSTFRLITNMKSSIFIEILMHKYH